jgi:hypothetical protein
VINDRTTGGMPLLEAFAIWFVFGIWLAYCLFEISL